jgi:hypothetical protein
VRCENRRTPAIRNRYLLVPRKGAGAFSATAPSALPYLH